MSFTVHELPKAKRDKESIFRWLHQQSPQGASSWLLEYDACLERLKRDAARYGEAQEKQDCQFDVRQALFKTRRGRVYRALFFIDGEEVYILRIRGPGQAPVLPGDIQ